MESSNETNYWPGFVDALTNTVIAMVFLVIVLTLSLAVFINAVVKQRLAKLVPDKACAVAPDPQTANRQTVDRYGTPQRMLGDKSRVIGDIRVADGPAAVVETKALDTRDLTGGTILLRFPGRTVEMDDSTSVRISEIAHKEGVVPSTAAVHIEVRGHEIFLTENQRIAFFRSMAVRNVLLKQGVIASNITVKLVESGPEQSGVVSVRFTKVGEP
jgi:hypothetical protein